MEETTRKEYLSDFRFRCHEITIKGGDLEAVKTAVSMGECPFIEVGFEKDKEYRRMRRYYRKAMSFITGWERLTIRNGLRDDLLKIIKEV